jgi:hypothetical protein
VIQKDLLSLWNVKHLSYLFFDSFFTANSVPNNPAVTHPVVTINGTRLSVKKDPSSTMAVSVA